jgi:Glycosyltransferase family 87
METVIAVAPPMRERLLLTLSNHRFRNLLLAVAGVPLAAAYAWQSFLRPLLLPGSDTPDLTYVYLYSAGKLAAGLDPYSTCLSKVCWTDLTSAGSPYPPVVSWLFVPFVHLNLTLVGAAGLVVAQLCVVLFVWSTTRGLGIRTWQGIALAALAVITFPPLIGEMVNRNLQVVLLALSGVWFMGFVAGDRWWSGAAVGAAVALKVIQAPMFLLGLWHRQVRASVAAAVTLALLWLVGAPQYLAEYLTKVAPGLDTGTGFALNVAPIATIARLFHPGSMYGDGTGVDTLVRAIGYFIAALVVGLTALALRTPRSDRDGLALEAAAVVAATPLLLSIVRPGHLILLLLPVMVVGAIAVRRRDWAQFAAVAAGWALVGPIYLWFSNILAVGVGLPWTRAGAESAVLGAVVIWLASLQALRRHAADAVSVSARKLGRPASMRTI